VVRGGVVVLEKAKLPEGAVVTVTIGETELLRATLQGVFRRSRRVRIRLRPSHLAQRD
jgi:hypothetical protein